MIVSNAAILAERLARNMAPQFDEFRSTLRASLPPGTRLLTVLDGDAIGYRSDQPYWHMAEFAIIDPGAFTPLLFTTKDQHVVRLKPAVQSIAAASAQQGSPPDIDELNDLAAGRIDEDEDIANVFPYLMRFQCHYDVAVVIHLGGPRAAIPPMLKLRHAGSFFCLYDILPDASAANDERREAALPRAGVCSCRAGCAIGLARIAATTFLHVPLDPNEGWNAYHALAATSGGTLYPPAGQLRVQQLSAALLLHRRRVRGAHRRQYRRRPDSVVPRDARHCSE